MLSLIASVLWLGIEKAVMASSSQTQHSSHFVACYFYVGLPVHFTELPSHMRGQQYDPQQGHHIPGVETKDQLPPHPSQFRAAPGQFQGQGQQFQQGQGQFQGQGQQQFRGPQFQQGQHGQFQQGQHPSQGQFQGQGQQQQQQFRGPQFQGTDNLKFEGKDLHFQAAPAMKGVKGQGQGQGNNIKGQQPAGQGHKEGAVKGDEGAAESNNIKLPDGDGLPKY